MTIGAVAALAGKPGILDPLLRADRAAAPGAPGKRAPRIRLGHRAHALIRLECDCSQGAEVIGDRQGVVRVGNQADVSIWAYEDQGVLAVCVCHVPGVVD